MIYKTRRGQRAKGKERRAKGKGQKSEERRAKSEEQSSLLLALGP
jgi:hypothetical protein